jgi:hypothetical protein
MPANYAWIAKKIGIGLRTKSAGPRSAALLVSIAQSKSQNKYADVPDSGIINTRAMTSMEFTAHRE